MLQDLGVELLAGLDEEQKVLQDAIAAPRVHNPSSRFPERRPVTHTELQCGCSLQ